jgi:hypothetical protein
MVFWRQFGNALKKGARFIVVADGKALEKVESMKGTKFERAVAFMYHRAGFGSPLLNVTALLMLYYGWKLRLDMYNVSRRLNSAVTDFSSEIKILHDKLDEFYDVVASALENSETSSVAIETLLENDAALMFVLKEAHRNARFKINTAEESKRHEMIERFLVQFESLLKRPDVQLLEQSLKEPEVQLEEVEQGMYFCVKLG